MGLKIITSFKQLASAFSLLFRIILQKLKGQKKDYFLDYKYFRIKRFYGEKCLDVGAGMGSFSNYLRNKNHNVSSIDVVDLSSKNDENNIKLFDGKAIPYEAKNFDTSMLMFVLHHTNHQDQLIKDCIRVTKDFLIIGEDIIQNKFDAVFGNIHLNSSPWAKGNDSFKTHAKWLEFFAKHNLELVNTITIPRFVYPVYPVSRNIYVLKIK